MVGYSLDFATSSHSVFGIFITVDVTYIDIETGLDPFSSQGTR